MAAITEIRILPPLAIARLGSSLDPMDNYDLVLKSPLGAREIVAAETLVVDPATGEAQRQSPPFAVRFRDADGRIRPVAPFFEVWARLEGSATLVPLTTGLLAAAGVTTGAVRWSAVVANSKAFRRTGDPKDRVEASTGWFSDHEVHPLAGQCPNFLPGASLPLGHVQSVKPSPDFPELRLRFTPAAGLVYGSVGDPDPHRLAGIVYDSSKGGWKGFYEPDSPEDIKRDPIGSWRATNPVQIFTSETVNGRPVSLGQFDDECDGLIDVAIETRDGILTAYARVTACPPPFAPDSLPVRTAADELEQALLGPDFEGPVADGEMADVREIVRRALETVRLMNTAVLNSVEAGLAGNDTRTYKRASEPIVDPVLADALAIRNRHERILLALESDSLAWFARVLRNYDQAGDLSALGRRRMPALMRGADGNYLALTRRQVSKIHAAADRARRSAPEGGSDG